MHAGLLGATERLRRRELPGGVATWARFLA